MKSIKYYLGLLSLLVVSSAYAQNEDDLKTETIDVVKPYDPSVSNADKINEQPSFSDTTFVSEDLSYRIFSKQFQTEEKIDTLSAADQKIKKSILGNSGFVRLGYGNFNTPYAEMSINTVKKKKYALGMYYRHHSSEGNIDEVPFSGFSDNKLKLYGKKFFRAATLSADIGYERNVFHYYGGSNFSVPVAEVPKGDIRQQFGTFDVQLLLESTKKKGQAFFDKAVLDFYSMRDDYDMTENYFALNTNISRKLFKQDLQFEVGVEQLSTSFGEELFDHSLTNIHFNPKLSNSKDKFNYRLGVHMILNFDQTFGDNITNLFVYPDIDISFPFIDDYIILYGGLHGKLHTNSFRSLATQNPFITSGYANKLTNEQFRLTGGLKGSLSEKVAYNVNLNAALVNNLQVFDVETVLNSDRTTLGILYPDANVYNMNAELSYRKDDLYRFTFIADYFIYDMDVLNEAYHRPDWKLSTDAQVKINDKLGATASLFYIGTRYSNLTNFTQPGDDIEMELDAIIDINLGLTYKMVKSWNAFVRVNNLLNKNYEYWNSYPVQGLNIIGGVQYTF